MNNEYIMFIVQQGNAHVITYALDREHAKRIAWQYLEGYQYKYIVTPLTKPGDRVKLDIMVNV